MLIKRIDGSASQLGAQAGAEAEHPDDVAVDQFAEAMKAKLADARAKGRSGWQECDPTELSYMLREHVEKGDPRDVANFCMFLWSLGKPIGDARPVVDLQLTPMDGIQVWIDAYTNAANGPHFMGHARIVQLLREYLGLRKILAQRATLPDLPEPWIRDMDAPEGSRDHFAADQMRDYARAHASQLALPAGPLERIRQALRGRDFNDFPGDDAELLESAANVIAEDGIVLRALPAGPVPEVTISEDAERKDFEAWAAEPIRAKKLPLARHANGAYSEGNTYQIWYGWISRARYSPAVAQPVADERALFEKEMRKQYGEEHFQRGSNDYGETFYNSSRINGAWDGWKARAALCQPAEEKGGA